MKGQDLLERDRCEGTGVKGQDLLEEDEKSKVDVKSTIDESMFVAATVLIECTPACLSASQQQLDVVRDLLGLHQHLGLRGAAAAHHRHNVTHIAHLWEAGRMQKVSFTFIQTDDFKSTTQIPRPIPVNIPIYFEIKICLMKFTPPLHTDATA